MKFSLPLVSFVAVFAFGVGLVLGYRVATQRAARPPVVGQKAVAAPAQREGLATRIEKLEAAVSADDTNVSNIVQLGDARMDSGRYPEAIAAYERAVQISPTADVLTDLGVCYRHVGKPAEALRRFEAAQKLDPNHWQSVYNAAVVAADLGQLRDARRYADRLSILRPEDPAVAELTRVLDTVAEH